MEFILDLPIARRHRLSDNTDISPQFLHPGLQMFIKLIIFGLVMTRTPGMGGTVGADFHFDEECGGRGFHL